MTTHSIRSRLKKLEGRFGPGRPPLRIVVSLVDSTDHGKASDRTGQGNALVAGERSGSRGLAQQRGGMTQRFSKRLVRLEQRLAPEPEHLFLMQFEGPGSERFPQPTPEQLAKARHVVTIKFVVAKDGRPATPEEIARGDTSDRQPMVDNREVSTMSHDWHDLA